MLKQVLALTNAISDRVQRAAHTAREPLIRSLERWFEPEKRDIESKSLFRFRKTGVPYSTG